MQVEKDPITGIETTGHEWDGCRELQTPIPRAFIWGYILTTAVAAVMWYLLPSWPIVASDKFPYFTKNYEGALGLTDTGRVARRIADHAKLQAAFDKKLTEPDINELAEDPKAREAYFAGGATLFREHCAMCHGRDSEGQPGFPDLTDNQWLWGDDAEGIYTSIKYGINTSHEDTQTGEMPAFGRDELLEPDQISDVVEYVLAISRQEHRPEAAKRGAKIFEDECASCHADGGVGGEGSGAPNLTDKHWIYGGDRAAILASVNDGRKGVMPHWVDRLRDAEMRQLALYVKWLNVADGDAPAEADGAEKAEDEKSADARAPEEKSAEAAAPEKEAPKEDAAAEKSAEEKAPAEETAVEEKASEEKAPAEEKAAEDAAPTDEAKSESSTSAEETPPAETASGEQTGDGAAADDGAQKSDGAGDSAAPAQ